MARQGATSNSQPGRRVGDAHRREIERLTRELLDYAKGHPLHRFSSGTRRFLEHVRPIVEQLDVVESTRRMPRAATSAKGRARRGKARAAPAARGLKYNR